MSFWDSFWNIFWLFFWGFAMFSYLLVLFHVVADLFRDRSLPGWSKAIWVVCMFFLPFLTVLVYLVARGPGMAARQAASVQAAQEATEEYVRGLAGTSPSDEITKARALLDAGTITEPEFTALKERALANWG